MALDAKHGLLVETRLVLCGNGADRIVGALVVGVQEVEYERGFANDGAVGIAVSVTSASGTRSR